MKKENPVKTKDPVTGKYAKADNCLVVTAKMIAVGVVVVIGAAAFGPKTVEVAAPTNVAPVESFIAEPTNPTAEQLTWCEKYDVKVENCVNVHTLVKNGEPVVGINYIEPQRDTYSDFSARQEQRKADLEYCAKNRTDWSCSEGQYQGQY